MTDWYTITITDKVERPKEVDNYSSPTTVYLHRNIEKIEVEDPITKEKESMWKYEERQMSVDEYSQYLMIQESVATITSFQEQEVIDKYTEELIAGGVI